MIKCGKIDNTDTKVTGDTCNCRIITLLKLSGTFNTRGDLSILSQIRTREARDTQQSDIRQQCHPAVKGLLKTRQATPM